MFSQKFNHDGARRVKRPRRSCFNTPGRRQDSAGMSQGSVSSRHLLNRRTGTPRNVPPPPQSEYATNSSQFMFELSPWMSVFACAVSSVAGERLEPIAE